LMFKFYNIKDIKKYLVELKTNINNDKNYMKKCIRKYAVRYI